MSNAFGDLTSSRMIHDVVDDLAADLRPLLRLATNFSERGANDVVLRSAAPGTVIKIEDWNLRDGIGGLYNVDPAVGYAAQDITRKAQRSFTLPSTIQATSVALTPAEYRILISDNIGIDGYARFRQRLQQAMVYQFALGAVTKFFSKITAANYLNATEVSVFSRETELGVEKKLFDRKLASKNNATVITDSKLFLDYTLDHQVIQDNTGEGQANRVMGNTVQSRVSNFSVTRTTEELPAQSPLGFAYTETAAFFVARIPDEPSFERDPVSLQEVVHPDFELPMLFRIWKDPKKGILQLDMATIMEFYVNQAAALERLVEPEE